jgi:hypothetical protein
VYGGYGAQGRYGNFMNMTQRGCGPVALADMYSRRSGGAISATGLTSAMASSGTYNPSMGTSVTGYMNTANAMGMHLTAGGVTPASLKQASPSNPITVIGSGSDFSTRSGNNSVFDYYIVKGKDVDRIFAISIGSILLVLDNVTINWGK